MTTTSHTDAVGYGGAPKKRRPLFEIVAALRENIEENEGVVTDELDALELELADKAEAYHVVMAAYEAEAKANKEAAKHFADRAAARERAAESLKTRLDKAMRDTGVDRIEAATVTVYFQASGHVEIEDEALFLLTAEDRFVKRGADSVKKAEIAKALKCGEAIEGAKLVETKSLRFR